MQAVSRPSRRTLASLLALALVVRLGALVLGADGLSRDPDNYRGLAENLLARGVLGQRETPSAYRPPLYPLLLVPCVAFGAWSPAAIGALHLTLAVATVWGVHWLGRQWRLGGAACYAAALVACDPILVHQTTQVMTETTAAFLATAALIRLTLACQRPTARTVAAAGACLALAALCRPTFLVLLVCAVPFVVRWAPTWSSRMGLAAAGFAAAAVVLTPWAWRNQARLGRPIVATTHGGYTLWLGNNASYYAFLRRRRGDEVWRAADFDAQVLRARLAGGGQGEIENDRREYARAWREIREQPRMFFQASLVRIGRFWGLVPRQLTDDEGGWRRWGRYATGAWYALEFAFAMLGLWLLARMASRPTARVPRRKPPVELASGGRKPPVDLASGGRKPPVEPASGLRKPPVEPASGGRKPPVEPASGGRKPPVDLAPWLMGLLLAASFTAVHTVFWTDLRMRAPVAPLVALLAAAGIDWLITVWLGGFTCGPDVGCRIMATGSVGELSMFGDGALTFQEFMMGEPLPLATIHDAVLEFLRGRDDAVVFGAQAVNAYVDEPRMTQDVDILSTRAAELAEELRVFLGNRFQIAVRVREVAHGLGLRLYQVRKPKNRRLVDLRPVDQLPPSRRVGNVAVVTPPELIARKVMAYLRRRGTPKSGTDWRDIAVLLLAFPELKSLSGPVRERLDAAGADAVTIAAWNELVAETIVADVED